MHACVDLAKRRMSHATVERVESFFRTPSIAEFDLLRQLALADDEFDPTALPVLLIERGLLEGEQPLELLEAADQLGWLWQLCPRLHFVRARIYEQMGSDAPLRASVAKLQTCLKMLLKTGDGSKNRPYHVTFISDERDLLRTMGAELGPQTLVQDDSRWIDVVSHEEGEVHFDVTELMVRSGAHDVSAPGVLSL